MDRGAADMDDMDGMDEGDGTGPLSLRPLTARSVVLSTLLGHHPPALPARALVRVGELFGTAEGTIRTALTRMVAAGDLEQRDGTYRLTERLLARQARQDDSRAPRTRPWDGTWEIAVVVPDRRTAPDRAALRQAMAVLRLAELREGCWLRPANLLRARPAVVTEQCTVLTGAPEGDPAELAAGLWDLAGWARRARALEAALDALPGRPGDLAERFTVSAAVLRHLLDDPVLPAPLLPADWPGDRLRHRYAAWDRDFRGLLLEHLGLPGADGI